MSPLQPLLCNLSLPPPLINGLLLELMVVMLAKGLKLTQLDIPPTTIVGDTIEMSCLYELDNDSLYAVKWYKNGREFFRFVPQDSPKGEYLKMDGVKVDLDYSNHQTVIIRDISLKSAGNYRCEVSTDAPTFVTLSLEKFMFVYALPKEGPAITGHKRFYRYGDTIDVNCSSTESKPAATISWLINDKIINANLLHNNQLIKISSQSQPMQSSNDVVASQVESVASRADQSVRIRQFVFIGSMLMKTIDSLRDVTLQNNRTDNNNNNNLNSNQLNLLDNQIAPQTANIMVATSGGDNFLSGHNISSSILSTEASSRFAPNALESSISNLQLTVDQHLFDFLLASGAKVQANINLQKTTTITGPGVTLRNKSIAIENSRSGEKSLNENRFDYTGPRDTMERFGHQTQPNMLDDDSLIVDSIRLNIKCLSSMDDKMNFYTMSDEIKTVLITKDKPAKHKTDQTLIGTASDDDFKRHSFGRHGSAKDAAAGQILGVSSIILPFFSLTISLQLL